MKKVVKVTNAKYIAKINGKEYPVVFTYGLKRELFNLITKTYLKAVKTMGIVDSKISTQSIEDSESLQKASEELAGQIVANGSSDDLSHGFELMKDFEDLFFEVCSLMLTKRDNYGDITENIPVNMLQYHEDFIENEDVLNELYELAQEKYAETTKKNTYLMNKTIPQDNVIGMDQKKPTKTAKSH